MSEKVAVAVRFESDEVARLDRVLERERRTRASFVRKLVLDEIDRREAAEKAAASSGVV